MSDEKKEAQKMGAKEFSKIAMIAASLWICVLTILKSLGIVSLEVREIVESAAAVVALWCPTFVSVWLDKIKDIRFGGGNEKC